MPVARLYSRMLRSSLSRAARSQAGCRQPHSQPLTKPDRKHSAIAGKSFVDAPCVYEQPGTSQVAHRFVNRQATCVPILPAGRRCFACYFAGSTAIARDSVLTTSTTSPSFNSLR